MKKKFRLRLFVGEEYQPLRVVPFWLWAMLFVALAGQVAFANLILPPPQARAEALRPPPSDAVLRLFAFGDTPMLARVVMLNLQGYDNQRGVSVPFRQLDYHLLGKWLDGIVALDERADYPHFSAAKIYGVVNDNERRRKMITWVRRQFAHRPDARWEWMAFSTNLAGYTLKDEKLATAMARELRLATTPGAVPVWARQMEIWFLENAGEDATAASMLHRQLLDGEINDELDYKFTYDRLKEMREKMVERGEMTDGENRRLINQLDAPQVNTKE